MNSTDTWSGQNEYHPIFTYVELTPALSNASIVSMPCSMWAPWCKLDNSTCHVVGSILWKPCLFQLFQSLLLDEHGIKYIYIYGKIYSTLVCPDENQDITYSDKMTDSEPLNLSSADINRCCWHQQITNPELLTSVGDRSSNFGSATSPEYMVP